MKIGLFFLATILTVTSLSLADFQVNTWTQNDQENPAIDMDSWGNFIVVWDSDYQDGNYDGVYGQRFTVDGTPIGSEFQVNVTTNGFQKMPDVAVDSSGRFVVVWDGDDGSYEGIYLRIYDVDGQAVTGEIQVNTYTNSRQINPAVAINDQGRIVIVWESNTYAGPTPGLAEWNIRGRIYDINGAPLTAELAISPTHQCGGANVAMASSGDFVVEWTYGMYYVVMRRYFADGTPKAGVEYVTGQLNAGTGSIGMSDDGNFIIAWMEQTDIYAQRFNSNGNTIGSKFMVNTNTNGMQGQPVVAMNNNDEFIVVWYGPDAGDYGIFGRRYDSSGVPYGDEFQINTFVDNRQFRPDVTLGDDGRFVTVWQSDLQDGSEFGIFGRMSPVGCCADFTGDWFVNFDDFCVLAEQWFEAGSFLETDLVDDDRIDVLDLAAFAQQWLTPCYECNEADIYNDGIINFKDYHLLAGNWLKHGGGLIGDITGDGIVNYKDLKAMCLYWLQICGQSVRQLDVQPCDAKGGQLNMDSNDTRFSITVQGNNLYFEDMIKANCCKEEIRLDMIVEGNKITIYEVEIISHPCTCLCDYPTTALLGPFADGGYTVEVFDVGGDSLGTVEVAIPSQ